MDHRYLITSSGGCRVTVTGVRDGECVYGCSGQTTEGIIFRVHGFIGVGWKMVEEIGEDAVAEALAKTWGVAEVEARKRLKEEPHDTLANHQPLGKNCRCSEKSFCDCPVTAKLELVQPGALFQYAEEAGNGDALLALVGRPDSTWADILRLVGKHTLSLHRGWYRVGSNVTALSSHNGLTFDLDAGECLARAPDPLGRGQKLFLIDEPSDTAVLVTEETIGECTHAMTKEDALQIASEVLEPTCHTAAKEQVAQCAELLDRLPIGGLKSAVQKAIRFGALTVDLALGSAEESVKVPMQAFAVTALALLFAKTGTFLPELQMYTRGCTSAFKRLGVIVYEDAWVSTAPVASLFAACLLCQACTTFFPSHSLVRGALRICSAACVSRDALPRHDASKPRRGRASCPWKAAETFRCVSPLGTKGWGAPAAAVLVKGKEEGPSPAELRTAAFLLAISGSFLGDEALVEDAARRPLKPIHCPGGVPAFMPVAHIVDQHCFRGIGHLMDGSSEFSSKFKQLFFGLTGVNPRRAVLAPRFEEVHARERAAQRLCLAMALGRSAALEETGDHVTVTSRLDPGVLAAAVGPVAVKSSAKGRKGRQLVVTLGASSPEDEVVMLKPSRGSTDLYGTIEPQERADAIAEVRASAHACTSPFPIGRSAKFSDCAWRVDGRPWSDVVSEGLSSTVPVHPPAPTDPEAAHAHAVQFHGAGVCSGAEAALRARCAVHGPRVLLRVLSLLRQRFDSVPLPAPALQGGKSSDEFCAYAYDADVYRLLLFASAHYPGALRPAHAPCFHVPNCILLREVERIFADAAHGIVQKGDGASRRAAPTWRSFEQKRTLMQHQRDAVDDLVARDAAGAVGHFVVMDTGYGKTLTSVAYLHHLKLEGKLPRYVLWVIPNAAVTAIVDELRLCGAPAVTLPKGGNPVAEHFNVVPHDTLRKVVDQLTSAAPEMATVFDEVDTCYAKTKRTSAAHQIASLCVKVVCQTATPMRNTRHEELAAWLALTAGYPIDKRNWWVAANSIVAKQIELGIKVKYTVKRVSPSTAGTGFIDAYSNALRGSQWLEAARVVWDVLDTALCRSAAHCARRRKGVLVEARDEAHRQRLISMLRAMKVSAGGFDAGEDAGVDAVVVRKDECRGYNWAVRLGALVRGVYPGNAASRHQMVGRLKRTGQARRKIEVVTVVMRGTIVELLHERHTAADTVNLSLEALAQKYSADILRMCDSMATATAPDSSDSDGSSSGSSGSSSSSSSSDSGSSDSDSSSSSLSSSEDRKTHKDKGKRKKVAPKKGKKAAAPRTRKRTPKHKPTEAEPPHKKRRSSAC
eukprot:TRINITY_DN4131_c0_g1_i3.p1 TRINITY_DN4131_c0_g1~~TRINITY_DN4131_c0_g1_i3.p1  ORF type:complete len:1316 (-),score=266.82 TRINITY_DN4131_c0_g1_i3:26-3973(-)